MRYAQLSSIGVIVLLLLLATVTESEAQVCLGLPAGEGQISLQAERSTGGGPDAVGGRLGLNFNTEYSVGFHVRRPEHETGSGLAISGMLGYEMEDYAPPVCFVIGVQHDRMPRPEGGDSTLTMVPVGLGVGKRLGSARGLSLALFLLPEYLYVAKPRPDGDYENFWDELGARSQGRGTIGLLVATPFIFASGRVEISTLNNYTPTVTVGLGLTF